DVTGPERFRDAYFSKEHRYSIGADATSGSRYLSIPVSSSAVDYEEYYEITDWYAGAGRRRLRAELYA
ncbi:hypothetical protein IPW42_25660, partial [Mycobacteroides abscessus subsp. massiliense]|nr:hypothetical protein [Mycobacteroides abscessus subsp. massiliense]